MTDEKRPCSCGADWNDPGHETDVREYEPPHVAEMDRARAWLESRGGPSYVRVSTSMYEFELRHPLASRHEFLVLETVDGGADLVVERCSLTLGDYQCPFDHHFTIQKNGKPVPQDDVVVVGVVRHG